MVGAIAAAAPEAATLLLNQVKSLVSAALDPTTNSLTSYAKTGRISSRVYIDGSVSQDPVVTDILKTVHTQYCAFILTALQMNQFVSSGSTVQDLLHVISTEDFKEHRSVSSSFSSNLNINSAKYTYNEAQKKKDEEKKKQEEERAAREAERQKREEERSKREEERAERDRQKHERDIKKEEDEKAKAKKEADLKSKALSASGKIVSFAGDDHIPAGKVIEVTLTNPQNPDHKVTVNLLVQLAPYIVPEPLAVQFIVKDSLPSWAQRWIQWKTGEISFFKDLILGSDIIENRQRLLKLDPSGVFADMMQDQQNSRYKTGLNLLEEKKNRARNIANCVLIFNQETVKRAKAETGIDITNFDARQKYFNTTFAMIVVVVDVLYNQVTFYYNGISDVGTFSFDQMKTSSKGGGSMDLVSVMNALNQGKSPKF